MKKQLIIIGMFFILISVELSGCNQISNLFLTDKDKLLGAWNTEGIWIEIEVPTVVVFSANGTFKIQFKVGTLNFSLNDGEWEMKGGILTMEMVDAIPLTDYTYHFSDDSKTLIITDIDSNESFILKKQ